MGSAMALLAKTSPLFGSRMRRAASTFALAGVIVIAAFGAASSPAHAEVTCDRVASKSGSDSATGTASNPYRTPQKLVDSLSAGQTGCLRQGVYAETSRLGISKGGTAGAPVTPAIHTR